jgi:hypothetical protein
MRKNYIFIWLLSLIVLISCEEIIDFKGADTEPKIVVYSIIHPDSIFKVQIGVSYPVTEWDYEPSQLPNALVKVFKNGELHETLHYVTPIGEDLPYYRNPFSTFISPSYKPVPGNVYSIEVSLSGYSTAISFAELPEKINIISFDTISIKEVVDEYYEMHYLQTSIRFQDPPGKENFYRVRVIQQQGTYNWNKELPYVDTIPIIVSPFYEGMFEPDPIMLPNQDNELFGSSESNRYGIFTDELIAGKEYELKIKMYHQHISIEHKEFAHYTIDFQSISKEMYIHLRSLAAQKNTEWDIFSEPVIVYSNILNGLGLFGAFESNAFTIKIGEYPIDGVRYTNYNYYW